MTSPRDTIPLTLINSDLVTAPTRSALQQRIDQDADPFTPTFFTPGEFGALSRVCARLLDEPRDAEAQTAALRWSVREMDRRLSSNRTDGWRYDALPQDGAAFRAGLALLEDAALAQAGTSVVELDDAPIDALLKQLKDGEVAARTQEPFDQSRWFEELLAEAVEGYYSHPAALQAIGYVGFSDAPGWQRTGLNELEPREASTVRTGA